MHLHFQESCSTALMLCSLFSFAISLSALLIFKVLLNGILMSASGVTTLSRLSLEETASPLGAK